MNYKVKSLVKAGIIAALYVVLVVVFSYSSFGPVQFRIAEMLTILPLFTPAAIPGLFIGCLLANVLGGAVFLDVVFGSLATLIAAYMSYKLRKKEWLVPVPPVLINAVVVGIILKFVYAEAASVWVLMGSVFLGQMVSAYGLGMILIKALKPFRKYIED